MLDTARAMQSEMDERGLAHLTAAITVNRPDMADMMIYLARATVFSGEMCTQGFGRDARQWSGNTVARNGDERLELAYGGKTGEGWSVEREKYEVREVGAGWDPYA